MRVLISTPWTAQGLTTLAVHLRAELEAQGHEVRMQAWGGRYEAIGHPADGQVWRGAFAEAAADCQGAIFPEVLEPAAVAWCTRRGVRTAWIPMWEYVGQESAEARRAVDVIVCPTRACHELMRKLGAGAQARWCPWSLGGARRGPRPTPEVPVLLHVARGVGGDLRNTSAVLEAYRRFWERGGRARLVVKSLRPLEAFCGPGALASLAAMREHVEVIDEVLPWGRMSGLYAQADLLVHPTRREGIGLVMLEALAGGVPVVTVDGPPMNEWVQDGVNGRTVACRPGRLKNHVREQEVDVEGLAGVLLEATSRGALEELKAGVHTGLAERAERFRAFWKGLLAEWS